MESTRSATYDEITLTVPAVEESLMIVRLTASGVASTSVADIEALEDFKIAVHEACYAIIHQPHSFEKLEICFTWQEELSVSVRGGGATVEREGEMEPDDDMFRIVLESLVRSANVETEGPQIVAIEMSAEAVRR